MWRRLKSDFGCQGVTVVHVVHNVQFCFYEYWLLYKLYKLSIEQEMVPLEKKCRKSFQPRINIWKYIVSLFNSSDTCPLVVGIILPLFLYLLHQNKSLL